MKRLILLLCAIALFAPSVARADVTVPLVNNWQFRTDDADAGLKGGWQNGVDPGGWTNVTVPHVVDADPSAKDYTGEVVWYRLTFTGPETLQGWSWALRFGAARRTATVWLNNVQIGTHSDPYTPFDVPATGLKPGQPNSLIVRIDGRRPAAVREGWWNWVGLTRPVDLVPLPPLNLKDDAVLADVHCSPTCSGGAIVDGWVENSTASVLRPSVATTLLSPSGEKITDTRTLAPLKPGEVRHVQIHIRVPKLEVWTPGDPQMYTTDVQLAAGGTVFADHTGHMGMRSVQVTNGRLLLNGRHLEVRGAAIQEDLPNRGPALDDADLNQIVSDLKNLHATVTRAQYLLDPRLLDKLDAAGILVWSQAAVYHSDEALKTAQGRADALENLRGTIIESRRHPSVITHSVANELAAKVDETPGTRDYLRDAAKLAKQLDPTIPAALDLLTYPGIKRQKAYSPFPLLGLNTYYGWYKGKPGINSTADLGDLIPYLKGMRKKYPKKAMAITEFGAEATFDGSKNVKGSYAFQTDYVRKVLSIVNHTPWLSGVLYWTVREFYVKPDWSGGASKRAPNVPNGLHNKGLLRYDGTPKPAWQIVRDAFARVPPLK